MIERVPRLFGILQSTGHCSLVLFGSIELSSLPPVKSIIHLYFSLSLSLSLLIFPSFNLGQKSPDFAKKQRCQTYSQFQVTISLPSHFSLSVESPHYKPHISRNSPSSSPRDPIKNIPLSTPGSLQTTVFFVVFRETIEAGIIVSVLLAFLKQTLSTEDETTYKRLTRQVWIGLSAGLFLCFVLGAAFIGAFYSIGKNLWEQGEDLWEGIFCLLACIIITVRPPFHPKPSTAR